MVEYFDICIIRQKDRQIIMIHRFFQIIEGYFPQLPMALNLISPSESILFRKLLLLLRAFSRRAHRVCVRSSVMERVGDMTSGE